MNSRDLDAEVAAAGIHRIPLPTPFAVGRVNSYLIDDEPLTLVDAGPNSGTSLEALHQGLRELGRTVEDLELLVISHQHIDHLGLIGLVAARSGAEVAALDVLAPFVDRYSEQTAADDKFATQVMLANGIPGDVVSALQSVSRAFRAWGARADVTRSLREGELLDSRTARCACITARATRPPTPCSTTPTGACSWQRTTCCRTSPRTR